VRVRPPHPPRPWNAPTRLLAAERPDSSLRTYLYYPRGSQRADGIPSGEEVAILEAAARRAGDGLRRPLDTGEVFRRYGPTVARWVARLAGTWIDHHDALQDVFVVVHRTRHRFEGPAERLPAWLFGIARNVVRQQRRRERFLRLFRAPAELAEDVAERGPGPLATVENREDVAKAHEVLDTLSDKQRTFLILFEVEGLSGLEIAELTQTKLATVFVNVHRARETFRKRLLERSEPNP